MRSCSMALQLLSTAVGSYLGGALVAAVAAVTASLGTPWLPRDLNHGHMDYFLVLIGLILVVNTVAFVWVAMRYEYKVGHGKGGQGITPCVLLGGPQLYSCCCGSQWLSVAVQYLDVMYRKHCGWLAPVMPAATPCPCTGARMSMRT